jgi:hypothetical protein
VNLAWPIALALTAGLLPGGVAARLDVVGGPVASTEATGDSLTLFAGSVTVAVPRGGAVEHTIGVRQQGAATRAVRLELTGTASPFAVIVGATDPPRRTTLALDDAVPAFVTVRLAADASAPEGRYVARVRAIDDSGAVAVGAELDLQVAVTGERPVRAALVAVQPGSVTVEPGRLLRLSVDVDATAPVAPVLALDLDGPSGPTPPRAARAGAVEPGGRRRTTASWPTAGWVPGSYEATLTVYDGTSPIGSRPVLIQVVAAGTLRRAVSLLGVRAVGSARPGGTAKIVVTVRNDGASDGRAVFIGELWQGTQLLAPVRSTPLLVAAGDPADIAVYAPVAEAGQYRLRGRASLDGAETGTVEIVLEVRTRRRPAWATPTVAAVALVGLLGLAELRRRRRSAGRPDRNGTEQTMGESEVTSAWRGDRNRASHVAGTG